MADTKTDAEKAEEIRAKLAPHISAVCAILDDARNHGLNAGFNISPDQFGRSTATVVITKPL